MARKKLNPALATPEDDLAAKMQAGMDEASESAEDAEAKAEEKAAVKEWLKRIKEARDVDKDERKKWPRWRRAVQGLEGDAKTEEDKGEWIVDTHLVQATMQALVPTLYAQDPEPSVTPEESVSPARYEQVKAFCKTLEIVLSRLVRDADLKSRARRCVRAAMTTPMGWVKVQFQFDRYRDPIIERRIKDTQDNLARVDMLLAELKESPECESHAKERSELADQLIGLEGKVEAQKLKGVVIDVVAGEDAQTDGGLRELSDYTFGRFTAHRVWYTEDKAMTDFSVDEEKLKSATRYYGRYDDPAKGATSDSKAALLCVWEIHDLETSTYKVAIEGCDFWAKPPYSPYPTGFRFTPLFGLQFHPVDGERWGMCDVAMWHKIDIEARRRLSAAAEHRRRNIPGVLFDASNIGEEDITKVVGSATQEYIGVTPLRSDMGVSQSFAPKPYANYDPATYDISDLRMMLDVISGVQDAQRGSVQKAKTATEAQILDQGMDARISDRRTVIEMWLEEIFRYIAEMALDVMTEEDAIRIAGPGAVWPKFTKDELYSLVSIRIRAGTTGKPDSKKQNETWAQVLPIISAGIEKIAGLRAEAAGAAAGGNAPMAQQLVAMAEAHTELLRETLRRADDRIDLDKFLPPPMEMPPPAAPPVAGIPGQPAPMGAPAPAGPPMAGPPIPVAAPTP